MNTHRRVDPHFRIVPDFFAQAVEETSGDPSGLADTRMEPRALFASLVRSANYKTSPQ